MTDLARAALALFLLASATVLLGMAFFRRYAIIRAPLGVMNLGDVAFMLGGIILIPYLYLALPGWIVATLLAIGTLGLLQLLLEPMLHPAWLPWLVAAVLVGADIALARQVGTGTIAFVAVNNVILLLTVVAVTNVWAQSGLRARDLAILAGALVLYDLVATSVLPLTNQLIDRLAGLPLTPVLAWPVGEQGWSGIGLGDLLFATVGPLVFRKAFGRPAGWVAIILAMSALALVFAAAVWGLLPGTFPVMVVLGPLLVAQYLAWMRATGSERTTAQYLAQSPPMCRSARCATPKPRRGATLSAPSAVPPSGSPPRSPSSARSARPMR